MGLKGCRCRLAELGCRTLLCHPAVRQVRRRSRSSYGVGVVSPGGGGGVLLSTARRLAWRACLGPLQRFVVPMTSGGKTGREIGAPENYSRSGSRSLCFAKTLISGQPAFDKLTPRVARLADLFDCWPWACRRECSRRRVCPKESRVNCVTA